MHEVIFVSSDLMCYLSVQSDILDDNQILVRFKPLYEI